MDSRVEALSGQVENLTLRVDKLTAELDALTARFDAQKTRISMLLNYDLQHHENIRKALDAAAQAIRTAAAAMEVAMREEQSP